ncbi:UNVERIFIED_CONTAM: hypothetical protein Slati_0944400 [Sesamum latifolium]|uniref:Uncharacterized protein n=1 Tax=Sesamum latifolium TaxID=2727402 RepID=A0AAW2XPT1_9LAMI
MTMGFISPCEPLTLPMVQSFSSTVANGVAPPPMCMFIGNVPWYALHIHSESMDNIAPGFHNSSQKSPSFVHRSIQNSEIIVRPSLETIKEGSRRWECMTVGYFLGKKPYFHHLNEFVRLDWPVVKAMNITSNGFYFFQFKMQRQWKK